MFGRFERKTVNVTRFRERRVTQNNYSNLSGNFVFHKITKNRMLISGEYNVLKQYIMKVKKSRTQQKFGGH